MPSTINASTTSTSGLVYNADASGILQLQSNGVTGLTVGADANVTVNTVLQTANGRLEPLVLETVKSASGASVTFTDIPSWVTRITLSVVGVSAAAAATFFCRVGTGGSLVSTGYTGATVAVSSGTPGAAVDTTSLGQSSLSAAASQANGRFVISKHSGNTWVSTAMISRTGSETIVQSSAGSITLAGNLDIIGLVLNTSTFDAGTINIMYE
jgi:hypothetical protein